jgi:hypothetical protein
LFVGTTPFLPLARYETARRGVVDARMIIVEHPLGGALADDVVLRADAARAFVADLIERAR